MKLRRRITRITGRAAPGQLGELVVNTRADANNAGQVMFTDTARHQVSIASMVNDPAPLLDGATVAAWQSLLAGTECDTDAAAEEVDGGESGMDGLRAAWVADSTTDGVRPVIGAMFGPSDDAATAKPEIKDITELQTRLTVQGPRVYEAAQAVGMNAAPASQEDLTRRCATVLAGNDEMVDTGQLDDLSGIGLTETAHHIVAAGPADDDVPVSHSMFVIDTSLPGLESAVDDLMGTWDLPVPLARCRLFRPFTSAAVAAEAGTEVPGRTWTILDVTGGEATDRLVAGFLDPRVRLHLRRKWGQQQTMLLASLGVGVAGWQNTRVAGALIDEMNDVAEKDKFSGRTRKVVRS